MSSYHDNEKMTLQAAETELVKVGNIIRKLKADLMMAQNTDSTDEELVNRIAKEVARLNELKKRHCNILLKEIHRLETKTSTAENKEAAQQRMLILENLLPPNESKKLKKKRRQQAKQELTTKERQFDMKKRVEDITCQRKMYHLLEHQGHDDTFQYFLRLHPSHAFQEGDAVYLTEKMDGTTMQATNNGVYKRFERRKQSEDWYTLSPEERYTLERVDLDNRANQYVAQALSPYLHLFEKLPNDVCIYFEAIGPRIGARFATVSELPHTIQVFDSSEKGDFVAFEKTIELCKTIGLPIVAYSNTQLNLATILDWLSKEPTYSYFEAPLEGFVVRPVGVEDSACAKIRVDDLASIADFEC